MEFPYRWGGPTYISIPIFLIFFHGLNDAKMQRNFFFGGGGYPHSQVSLMVIFCSYTFEQTNNYSTQYEFRHTLGPLILQLSEL